MVQASVGLVCAVDRDDMQDPLVLATQDADVDQGGVERPDAPPAEVADPVVGFMRSRLTGDLGQGGVQQWLSGRRLVDGGHVPVDDCDVPLQAEVEQQRSAQPQIEVGRVDEQPAAGAVAGQQVQVLGERGHGDTVACRSRCRAAPKGVEYEAERGCSDRDEAAVIVGHLCGVVGHCAVGSAGTAATSRRYLPSDRRSRQPPGFMGALSVDVYRLVRVVRFARREPVFRCRQAPAGAKVDSTASRFSMALVDWGNVTVNRRDYRE